MQLTLFLNFIALFSIFEIENYTSLIVKSTPQ